VNRTLATWCQRVWSDEPPLGMMVAVEDGCPREGVARCTHSFKEGNTDVLRGSADLVRAAVPAQPERLSRSRLAKVRCKLTASQLHRTSASRRRAGGCIFVVTFTIRTSAASRISVAASRRKVESGKSDSNRILILVSRSSQ
jgi:hypothetical protein